MNEGQTVNGLPQWAFVLWLAKAKGVSSETTGLGCMFLSKTCRDHLRRRIVQCQHEMNSHVVNQTSAYYLWMPVMPDARYCRLPPVARIQHVEEFGSAAASSTRRSRVVPPSSYIPLPLERLDRRTRRLCRARNWLSQDKRAFYRSEAWTDDVCIQFSFRVSHMRTSRTPHILVKSESPF
ncbi:hypothetical protein CALVIDRAFT_221899 [Calocera viscosa TUFC12733]|uniref:Uncharacterized protein n=1 Tax=Calocera viscosa (strain TUFC12733) TaxID=1330018 RepID=A0A167K683_CALVF|nr:hypothetical protein CALVIDRAFT_221899 [Calocera viscosa TUFC12733]